MSKDLVLRGSPDRFGYEWSRYDEILDESRQQLEKWLGSNGLTTFSGKHVLDVGCGMGRNPYWMAKAGALSVTAVDVDDNSLRSARKNLAEIAHARVLKYSVYDLDPSNLGTFDRVTCIGVLHHLADPKLALQKLWGVVNPGGDLVMWVYGREGNRLLLPAIQALRWLGSRLPIRATHVVAKLVALIAWPFIRFLPWRNEYYQALKELAFENVESIIFDQMLPKIAHYWTRAEVHALVEPLGGEVTVEFAQGNSWHVRVLKSK